MNRKTQTILFSALILLQTSCIPVCSVFYNYILKQNGKELINGDHYNGYTICNDDLDITIDMFAEGTTLFDKINRYSFFLHLKNYSTKPVTFKPDNIIIHKESKNFRYTDKQVDVFYYNNKGHRTVLEDSTTYTIQPGKELHIEHFYFLKDTNKDNIKNLAVFFSIHNIWIGDKELNLGKYETEMYRYKTE